MICHLGTKIQFRLPNKSNFADDADDLGGRLSPMDMLHPPNSPQMEPTDRMDDQGHAMANDFDFYN